MSQVLRRWSSEREGWSEASSDLPKTSPFRGGIESVGFALADGIGRLTTENPRLDAEVLLAHAMGVPRSWLVAHIETELTPKERERFFEYVDQVAAGVPLPYVLGRWEFFKLGFKVDPRVLIPRPETELMVETALAWAKTQHTPRIVDVGTGSGCVAITLAVNAPAAVITATDVSAEALSLARENALEHAVADRIQFAAGDGLLPAGSVDLICCNPPYVATGELDALPSALHEPRLALDGGPDGLTVIRPVIQAAPRHLLPDGVLLMEIGASQREAVLELARAAFPHAQGIRVLKDLAGLDRLLVVQS
ncbi:MAG: peptide chain release factor N(5)-glutamine methyltransferase [Anaerolineales bacterium]